MTIPKRKRIADTNKLISFWRLKKVLEVANTDAAVEKGREFIVLYDAPLTLTPILVEFLAGVRSGRELQLARAFLSTFYVADGGWITREDWQSAVAIAERVPRNGKPRQLGDCLIRAIVRRLKCELDTADEQLRSIK